MKAKDCLMWPCQVHYRISCETAASGLFNEIDIELAPRVFLLGFRIADGAGEKRVCIDPPGIGFQEDEFFHLAQEAEKISKKQAQHLPNSGVERHAEHKLREQKKALRDSVDMIINKSPNNPGDIAFASKAMEVEEHLVFVVLLLKQDVYHAHLFLSHTLSDMGIKLHRSLAEASVHEYLEDRALLLMLPNPGEEGSFAGKRPEILLRESARSFMQTIAVAGGNDYGLISVFDDFEEISKLKYEGAESLGYLIIAPKNHPALTNMLDLLEPFPLSHIRKARKFLELTTREGFVHTDSRNVIGMVEIKKFEDPKLESMYIVQFTGTHSWQVEHNGNIILQMYFGLPRLPRASLLKEHFWAKAKRIFPDLGPKQLERLFELARATTQQKKGGMLIISNKAAEEARRFSTRCFSIEPMHLDDEMLVNLCAVDGGVLIDLDGTVHAYGVILDGVVGQYGDPGRGSRYNSALTYWEHNRHEISTLIVVVSEDGMANLVPNLLPKIKLSRIVEVIELLEKFMENEEVEGERFNDIMGWLERNSFYLTAEQCQKINRLKTAIALKDQSNTLFRFKYPDFKPNPSMGPHYYEPE